jgi:hypothetical protein
MNTGEELHKMKDWLMEDNMRIWLMLIIICIAGAIGGIINALLTDQGFVKPHKQRNEGVKIYRPGFLGNILTGSIAAGISWGLYGPLSSYVVLGFSATTSVPSTLTTGLTLSSLVGAVLVGVGGARWLTNEADKKLLRNAASIAASAKPSADAAERIAFATPAETVEIASELAQENANK